MLCNGETDGCPHVFRGMCLSCGKWVFSVLEFIIQTVTGADHSYASTLCHVPRSSGLQMLLFELTARSKVQILSNLSTHNVMP
jgi:hypothetical protein